VSGHVYEVFRQERPGDPMTHSGSLLAPDDELARQYARDLFSRRSEALRLWVVPRGAIAEIDEPDLLKPPGDRAYRVPAGYTKIAEKVRAARARVAPVAASGAADQVEAPS
jgi:ring-1,2-phenylacetyl-CoA epoxidase subunit PaaB